MVGPPLRILQVCHGFPPDEHAGAELSALYLSRELLCRGHAVQVLARTGRPSVAPYELHEETVEGVPVVRLRTPVEDAGSLRRMYQDPRARRAFEGVLERGFDVVHVHHLYGLSLDFLEAAVLAGARVVVTLHDFWYLCHRGQRFTPRGHLCEEVQPWRCSLCIARKRARWSYNALRATLRERGTGLLTAPVATLRAGAAYVRDNLLVRPIEQRLAFVLGQLDRAHLCLSPSHFLLEEYRRHGLSRERSDYCENGQDVAWARDLAPRQGPHAPLRFGFLGTFLPSKGVEVLVEAIQGVPHGAAEFTLHGTSPWDGGKLWRRLRESNRHPDARFPGAFSHDRLPEVLASLDVLVVPSLWFENAPFTLDEAALAEIPVIASDRGGMRECVQRRGNGLLFRPGDAEDLRRAILRFVEEPGLWESLRRPRAPVRTVADHAAELEHRYRELLAAE